MTLFPDGIDSSDVFSLGDEHSRGSSSSVPLSQARRETLNSFVFAVSDAEEVHVFDERNGVGNKELPDLGWHLGWRTSELLNECAIGVELHDPSVTVSVRDEDVFAIRRDCDIRGLTEVRLILARDQFLPEDQRGLEGFVAQSHDLVSANVRDPDVALGIHRHAMRHVEFICKMHL